MEHFYWDQISGHENFCHIARARIAGNNASKMHKQDFPEVFWIEDGQGIHRVNGRTLPLRCGDMIFMRSTDRHSLSASPGTAGFVLVNIAFPQSSLDFLRARYFPSEPRGFWARGVVPDTVSLNAGQLAWLGRWVTRLDSGPRSLLDAEIFLMELLRELTVNPDTGQHAEGPSWLLRAIESAADPKLFSGGTVALARVAGCSPQHLNASLKRFHGMTATETLNRARMDFAARELRTSTKKVLEVCLDCGFQNLAHFYKIFRIRFGQSPGAYRNAHQQILR